MPIKKIGNVKKGKIISDDLMEYLMDTYTSFCLVCERNGSMNGSVCTRSEEKLLEMETVALRTLDDTRKIISKRKAK